MDTHRDIFRCQSVHGRCRYPDEFIHDTHCRYYVPLPQEMQHPPRHTGHGHQTHGGGHTSVSGNRSGRHRISGERVGKVGGHHSHSVEEILYDDSCFGNSGSRIDENDPAFSDVEDVFVRSMSQASNHGFRSGQRRGDTGRNERISRGENSSGAATSHSPPARGEAPSDPPPITSIFHAWASRPIMASRRGAVSDRDRTQKGEAPRETSNAATSRCGADHPNAASCRSAASHNDRGTRDALVQGEAPHDPSSDAGARIQDVAPANTISRTTTAAHCLRESPIGTAEGAAPATTMSLITAAAHQVKESPNSMAQGATDANLTARQTVAVATNMVSRTAAATHQIQQRLHSMNLGAAKVVTGSRSAAIAHSVQSPLNNSTQDSVAQTPGGEISRRALPGHQASLNGAPKSVIFETGKRKTEAGVSDDY